MKGRYQGIARTAMIAAVYATTCIVLAPISYGAVQVRVADALMLLPLLYPEAIGGVTLGCLLANVVAGLGVWDIGIGTIANLIAALLTRRCRSVWLGGVPPVAVVALLVGTYLSKFFGLPWAVAVGYLAVGQAIAVYGLGVPLVKLLQHVEASRDGNRPHAHQGDHRRAIQPEEGSQARRS